MHGKGILYITSLGVAYESQKYGHVLDISYEWMQSYSAPKKDKFHIVWDVPQGHRFMYVFGVSSAKEVAGVYVTANKEYANSVSEIDALKAKLGSTK